MSAARQPQRQRGFLVIAAVFLLVVLAGLVGYLMTVSTTSQAASAADASSAKAYQAARGGIEWASYQVLRNAGGSFVTTTCPGAGSVNLAFGSALSGFTTTVSCTSTSGITEGGGSVTIYAITSNACNEPVSGACRNPTTTSSTYVERQLSATLTD
jgi:MSHA biogenesis protein MshP